MIDVAEKRDEMKTRFLVKIGNRLEVKYLDNVMLFYAEGKTVYLVTFDNKKYIIDYTLEQLENDLLDSFRFFRINRKYILNIDSIEYVKQYINHRLIIYTENESIQVLAKPIGQIIVVFHFPFLNAIMNIAARKAAEIVTAIYTPEGPHPIVIANRYERGIWTSQ